jgi:Domain of unknown function (DUF4314)
MKRVKPNLPSVGTRIYLIEMPNEPDPIPSGATGTVTGRCDIPGIEQVEVDWDSPNTHRILALIPGIDNWAVLPKDWAVLPKEANDVPTNR